MLQVARRAGTIAALALVLSLGFATAGSAQMREFTGQINKVTKKKIIIDNRMGDKVSFTKVDETVVEGEKDKWGDLKKKDWATVHWKFIDKPRKAYKVVVLPPREEDE
ncbi:MAG: hypothetical protein QNK03_05870 [Myxococcota bacterium]|nr:hypothetical protein [Myxococcota bacterium]